MKLIKRKKKICSGCGAETFIWSHGRCKLCSIRSAGSGTRKPIVVKPTGENAIFKEIWDERPRVSYVSGTSLDRYEGSALFVNLFSHLLPKGKYPEARLDKNNIILLTPQEHLDWHSYTREKLLSLNSKWQEVFDLYDKKKEHYGTNRG